MAEESGENERGMSEEEPTTTASASSLTDAGVSSSCTHGDSIGNSAGSFDLLESLAQYRRWVKENPEKARRVEEVGRAASFLVPSGLGTTGELISEGVYSLSNLLALYNDGILVNPEDRGAKVDESNTQASADSSDGKAASTAAKTNTTVVNSHGIDLAATNPSSQSGGAAASVQTNGHVDGSEHTNGKSNTEQKQGNHEEKNEKEKSLDAFERLPRSYDSVPRLEVPFEERSIRWALTALSSVDVVLELAARHGGGEKIQRRLILIIEIVRAALKLTLLLKSKKRHLIDEGRIERVDKKPADRASNPPRWWKGRNTGMRFKLDDERLASSSEYIEGQCDSVDVSNIRVLGELLHILRPVAYASTSQLAGWGSWKALIVSMVFDATSYYCSMYAAWEGGGGMTQQGLWKHAYSLLDAFSGRGEYCSAWPRVPSNPEQGMLRSVIERSAAHTASLLLRLAIWGIGFVSDFLNADAAQHCLTDVEYNELSRRKRMWVLYLLRTPVFQLFTSPAVDRTVNGLSYLPLVGMLSRLCKDIIHFHSRVHFHHSGS
eukprot:gb/GECG01006797.1/.p1 GENE.gb/GECG01006797.1/~~gb/GECG01006797.1/.p1  ORF type:complete len:549 (+),score=63.55 gb/GECG01006797.1/:1-1647(+)